VKIFPHFDSNIDTSIHFNTICEQVYRHSMICNTSEGLIITLNAVFDKTLTRGYGKQFIINALRRAYHKRKIFKSHISCKKLTKKLDIFKV
jgi:hypothetical protein